MLSAFSLWIIHQQYVDMLTLNDRNLQEILGQYEIDQLEASAVNLGSALSWFRQIWKCAWPVNDPCIEDIKDHMIDSDQASIRCVWVWINVPTVCNHKD